MLQRSEGQAWASFKQNLRLLRTQKDGLFFLVIGTQQILAGNNFPYPIGNTHFPLFSQIGLPCVPCSAENRT